MVESLKVAVVGGGISGLITARELRKEGHHVTVFEKADRVGGLWRYSTKVDSDPLSLDPNREVSHSSVFKSLRVNLPRQIMAFSDFPNVPKEEGDPRNFPGHEEVLRYIEDFAHHFGLMELIRFKHEVVRVELVDEVSHKWVVESKTQQSTESNWELKEEVFDAVVICNGNHTEPRIADFPGRDTWPRLQMHSHNYRTPEQFENKVVVLIGFGPSAIDILKDISPIAKEVHHSVRGSDLKSMKPENNDNTWQHPMIESAGKDGKVVFKDGSIVDADIILHCTGYTSHFPFLKTNGIVTVDDNRVGPLYKHVFPPSLAPWISFVGLNNRAAITRVYELQGKWVAKVLSGAVELPSQKAMTSSVEEDYSEMEKWGLDKYHTHSLQYDEYEYVSWLADQLSIIPPKWWKAITWFTMVTQIFQHGGNFRETWDVDKWLQDIDSSD